MSDSYIPQDQPSPVDLDPSITAPDPSNLIDDDATETVTTEFDTVARLLPGVVTFPIEKSIAPEGPKAYRDGFFDSKTVGLGALFADIDAETGLIGTQIAPINSLTPRPVGVERTFDGLTADEILTILRGAPRLWDEIPEGKTEYPNEIIRSEYSQEVSKSMKRDPLLDNGTLSHAYYPKHEHGTRPIISLKDYFISPTGTDGEPSRPPQFYETTDWQTNTWLANNIQTSPLPEPLPGVRAEFRVVKNPSSGKFELVRVPIILNLPTDDSTTAKSEPDTTEKI